MGQSPSLTFNAHLKKKINHWRVGGQETYEVAVPTWDEHDVTKHLCMKKRQRMLQCRTVRSHEAHGLELLGYRSDPAIHDLESLLCSNSPHHRLPLLIQYRQDLNIANHCHRSCYRSFKRTMFVMGQHSLYASHQIIPQLCSGKNSARSGTTNLESRLCVWRACSSKEKRILGIFY